MPELYQCEATEHNYSSEEDKDEVDFPPSAIAGLFVRKPEQTSHEGAQMIQKTRFAHC